MPERTAASDSTRRMRVRTRSQSRVWIRVFVRAAGLCASLVPVATLAQGTTLIADLRETPTPLGIAAAELGPASADAPLTEHEMAVHVLDRLAFGGTPEDLQYVLSIGWEAWVEQQLDPASIDDPYVDQYLADHAPALSMDMSQAFRTYRPPYDNALPRPPQAQARNRARRGLQRELQDAVLFRAVHSNRRFAEVMAEFWRNHFNIDQSKDDVAYLAADYERDVVRRFAFDLFGKMLLSSARHPGMLIYLDNIDSQKPLLPHEQALLERFGDRENPGRSITALARHRGLNENYARELMELHTLGVDNGYTQQDVTETARVLTGWTAAWVRPDGRTGNQAHDDARYGFYFRSDVHDPNPKTILGARLRGNAGENDGINLVVSLATHRNTAQYVSYKLCQYLVRDDPPEALVRHVAQRFLATNGDLTETYRAILFHPEFRARRNFRAKFKTPFEYTVSALRATQAQLADKRRVHNAMDLMGQPIYRCEDPTGYADTFDHWLDPGVLVYRWDLALNLTSGGLRGADTGPLWEDLGIRPRDAVEPDEVPALIRRFCPAGVGRRTQALITDHARRGAPAHEVVALILGSPAFQQQ